MFVTVTFKTPLLKKNQSSDRKIKNVNVDIFSSLDIDAKKTINKMKQHDHEKPKTNDHDCLTDFVKNIWLGKLQMEPRKNE